MLDYIDVAIGLLVYFSLLSMVGSAVLEVLLTVFRDRGRVLERVVLRIAGNDRDLCRGFYENASIKSLRSDDKAEPEKATMEARLLRKTAGVDQKELPSYVSPELFARAFYEAATGSQRHVEQTGDLYEELSKVRNKDARELLLGLAMRAGGDKSLFLKLLAEHFNLVNERATGWFRRKTSKYLFYIGFALAVITNGDAVFLAKRLVTDQGLRAELVAKGEALLAQEAAKTAQIQPPPEQPAPSRTNMTAIPTGQVIVDPSPIESHTDPKAVEPTPLRETPPATPGPGGDAPAVIAEKQTTPTKVEDKTDATAPPAALEKVAVKANSAHQISLLREQLDEIESYTEGWLPQINRAMQEKRTKLHQDGQEPSQFKLVLAGVLTFFGLLIVKLPGFLITAFAVSLGAPFWFDLLKKTMSIRSSMAPGKSVDGEKPSAKTDDPGAPLIPGMALVGPPYRPKPTATRASVSSAHFAAKAAIHAYDSLEEIKLWLAGDEAKGWTLVNGKGLSSPPLAGQVVSPDTQLYIFEKDGEVLVAFRGTEKNLSDWTTDAKLKLVPFETAGKSMLPTDLRVHEGFQSALDSVWGPLKDKLLKLAEENKRCVSFCGHSLGGALAVLAAARWRAEQMEEGALPGKTLALKAIHTIGQPRVGNEAFATKVMEFAAGNYTRAVNHWDIVPKLPPVSLGYTHSGQLHYFAEDGSASLDPSFASRLLDLTLGNWVAEAKIQSELIARHTSTQYGDLYRRWLASLPAEENLGAVETSKPELLHG